MQHTWVWSGRVFLFLFFFLIKDQGWRGIEEERFMGGGVYGQLEIFQSHRVRGPQDRRAGRRSTSRSDSNPKAIFAFVRPKGRAEQVNQLAI